MRTRLCLWLLLAFLPTFAQQASPAPPTDFRAPIAPALYDWRHTHWFGATGGTVTGAGLSYRYWGERHGWQLTLLPLIYDDEGFLLVAGGARLFSLNAPPPAQAGPFGFTSRHYYWFLSTAHGALRDLGTTDYLGSASVGVGMDLERRVSRFSLMLGIGPNVAVSGSGKLELHILPTLECGWHFGAPHRTSP